MANRIEQVIGDIEEYIDGCKMQAFSNTKIIVDRPQIEEFLDELRQYTPEEVKKYQRMLSNRDKIMADAKKRANEIEEKAVAYANHMVEEHQITKMAYDKANEILEAAKEQANKLVYEANEQANQIRQGSQEYSTQMLENLHSVLAGTIDDYQNRYATLISSLSEHQNIVEQNINELNGMNMIRETPKLDFLNDVYDDNDEALFNYDDEEEED
ncbi:MAG: hypothetical protein J6Z38_02675 [Lachnospiraceae bacterium]|nr:hypothetical protein [Lachnospiraceae bacterium]